jgi:tetratricopeptide (TPR) repeat protein
MAESYMHDELPHEAELALKKALATGPRSSSIPYENLGRVYLYYLDQDEPARDILVRSRTIFPNAQSTRVLLAIALQAGGYSSEAMVELLPFAKSGLAESDTYVCLGWLYLQVREYAKAVEVLVDGHGRFAENLGIINNLAYSYLMLGKVEPAAGLLSSIPKNAELHAELMATFGLLRLWQGDERAGREFYDRAAVIADGDSAKNRVRRVRQKEHLELARFFVRRQDFRKAETEVRQGLALRGDFPLSYRPELEELRAEISMHL